MEWWKAGKHDGDEYGMYVMKGDDILVYPETLDGEVNGLGVNCEVQNIPPYLGDTLSEPIKRYFRDDKGVDLLTGFMCLDSQWEGLAENGEVAGQSGRFSLPLTDKQADEIMEANTHNDMLALGSNWTLSFVWDGIRCGGKWHFADGSECRIEDIDYRI